MSAESVRIRVRRTGGVAGITRSGEVDLEALPADQAGEIRSLLEHVEREADEADLDRRPAGVPDTFAYEITVEEDEGRQPRVIRFQEREDNDELRQLVRRILQPRPDGASGETPGGAR